MADTDNDDIVANSDADTVDIGIVNVVAHAIDGGDIVDGDTVDTGDVNVVADAADGGDIVDDKGSCYGRRKLDPGSIWQSKACYGISRQHAEEPTSKGVRRRGVGTGELVIQSAVRRNLTQHNPSDAQDCQLPNKALMVRPSAGVNAHAPRWNFRQTSSVGAMQSTREPLQRRGHPQATTHRGLAMPDKAPHARATH
eukprot:gene21043-27914_t